MGGTSMAISILFFGATADIVGSRKIQVEPRDGELASSVFERILNDHPSLARHELHFSINQNYATGDETLYDGDEVGIFTAVSGG
jgi:molybdopterin converting factor small subunit